MDGRLRQRLSMMGRDIESVLARYHIQSRVKHESLEGSMATYVAAGCGPLALTTWDAIEAECRENLCTAHVELALNEDSLIIAVELPEVLTLSMLHGGNATPSTAASYIGLDADEQTLTLRFSGRNAQHVLFSGGPGSGKTSALRTTAVSLALASRQSQAQMIFVAPREGREEANGPGLNALHYLPHALAAVARNLEDVANVLAFVADELQYRRHSDVIAPSIVVFVDDVDVLVEEGGAPVCDPLRMVLAEGTEYGIYFVMAARPAGSGGDADIADLLTLKAVSQIWGRIDAPAGAVTGWRYEEAHHLRGRGDFLLSCGGGRRRFQAAYVDTYDLTWWLNWLQEQRPARLLAQTYA